MDFQRLRSFVAIAENGTISRAAESLGLVQSALSHQMQALERSMGVELFDRESRGQGRRVRLSDVGRVFLAEARDILARIDTARARVEQAAAGRTGSMRVGFQLPACRNRLVPESFYRFRTGFPDVDLSLTPMTLSGQIESIEAGKIDAGLLYLPIAFPQFEQMHLGRLDWLLALPRRHRLATRKKIRLGDLRDESFIWLPRTLAPILTDEVMARCHAGGLIPRVTQEAFEEPVMLNLVSVGLGITFVLADMRDHCPADVVLKPVADFSLPMTLALIWKARATESPLAHFVETVRGVKGGTPAP